METNKGKIMKQKKSKKLRRKESAVCTKATTTFWCVAA